MKKQPRIGLNNGGNCVGLQSASASLSGGYGTASQFCAARPFPQPRRRFQLPLFPISALVRPPFPSPHVPCCARAAGRVGFTLTYDLD